MSRRVAYIVNQYPKVSHSFIRREILALEAQGVEVVRLSVRGHRERHVDAADVEEQNKTVYLLAGGLPDLAIALILTKLSSPLRYLRALGLALRSSVGSSRNLFYHLAWLAEACVAARHLRGKGVGHLHAHFGTNSTDVAMLTSVLMDVPFSFTAHGPEEFDRPLAIGLPEKISRAQFVVAVSSFGRSQLFRWVSHEHWQKIRVVHCGLDAEFLDAGARPIPDTPQLVCVGRICEQKGQLLLIEAVRILAARGVQCRLVLAGDGDMRAEAEARIAAGGLQARVSITGWIPADRVLQEIVAARALVLPSFAEGLPVVIMEAMALGRPVISTYVAGIPELVAPGESGWLIPAGDVEALASAIEECLTTSPGQLETLGSAGRERVRSRHNAIREARKLVEHMAQAALPAGEQ
jgi:glycosyltransferase involved in cell wall biosynthesis